MKKTYMKPTMEVVKMQVNQMICLSAGLSKESQNNDVALGHENDDDFDW